MKHIIPFSSFLLSMFSLSFSQQSLSDTPEALVASIEEITGTSNALVNGPASKNYHINIAGTPYYPADNWICSRIFIRGTEFINQEIKYDVIGDHIILNHYNKKGNKREIMLDAMLIDSVTFNNRVFIAIRDSMYGQLQKSFAEIIFRTDEGIILSTYHKYHQKSSSQVHPYGKFSDTKQERWLINGTKTCNITRRRDFLAQFKSQKKSLKRFMRSNSIRYQKATNHQLKKVFQYYEGITD